MALSAVEIRKGSRGGIVYDDEAGGHVCTCTRSLLRDEEGEAVGAAYERTVVVDREIEPTEGGSWHYSCRRCGAGAWSGC